MADIYLMEDLKDAIASHLAPHLDKDNILEIYHLAEKYTAPKLKEKCSDLILTSVSIAKQGLGIDAANISKKRKEGHMERGMIVCCNTTSIWWTRDGLSIFKSWRPDNSINWFKVKCEAGTIGRIVEVWSKEVTIRWMILSPSNSWRSSLGSWERHQPFGDPYPSREASHSYCAVTYSS